MFLLRGDERSLGVATLNLEDREQLVKGLPIRL
jgi:hypothetical protein